MTVLLPLMVRKLIEMCLKKYQNMLLKYDKNLSENIRDFKLPQGLYTLSRKSSHRQSREVSWPRDLVFKWSYHPEYDTWFGSSAACVPVKCQSNRNSPNPYISRELVGGRLTIKWIEAHVLQGRQLYINVRRSYFEPPHHALCQQKYTS